MTPPSPYDASVAPHRTRERCHRPDQRGGRAAFAARNAAPTGDTALDVVDARFKSVADPTRLRILNLLAAGELCVCDVVDILALPQPTVSRHLGLLRRAGLVSATRLWKFAHYRLAEPGDPVHRAILTCVDACAARVPTLVAERVVAAQHAAERARQPCD
jgi:ArsR family transcriptional regulator